MPIGSIVNSIIIISGGLIGSVLGHKLPKKLLSELLAVNGLAAMTIGITCIAKLANLTPVILAILLGTIIGESLELEMKLTNGIRKLIKSDKSENEAQMDILVTAIVLFVFSGTGIFGIMDEGLTGNSSIMLTKSVLDFFTAVTFGTSAGYLISFVAIPQFIFQLILFYSAWFIMPIFSETMLLDFRACGGIISLAVGLKVMNIRTFRVINMLPGLILVIPLSYFWGFI